MYACIKFENAGWVKAAYVQLRTAVAVRSELLSRYVCILCRPLALGNAADAVEILSAGYILSAFKQEDGSSLTSTQKGMQARDLSLRNSFCARNIEASYSFRMTPFEHCTASRASSPGRSIAPRKTVTVSLMWVALSPALARYE